jgi:hypothetical protein
VLSRDLVHALRRFGIRVASAYDGDEEEDGDLMVALNVHVQVPTFGGMPRVMAHGFHGDSRCYPPRKTVAELAADIRCALNETPCVIPVSYLH